MAWDPAENVKVVDAKIKPHKDGPVIEWQYYNRNDPMSQNRKDAQVDSDGELADAVEQLFAVLARVTASAAQELIEEPPEQPALAGIESVEAVGQ